MRSGKSRFRSEAKLRGRQIGIDRGNACVELKCHVFRPPFRYFTTIIGRAQWIHSMTSTRARYPGALASGPSHVTIGASMASARATYTAS